MTQSKEFTGKTMEDALRAALEELGLTEDEIQYEVVTRAKSGFLGFGAVPARIRVDYDDGKAEPKPPKAPRAPREEKAAAPRKSEKPAAPKAERPAAPVREEKTGESAPAVSEKYEDRARRAESFLKGLLERMGVECTITIAPREGGGMDVTLDGPNMGAVIGRRGETLDAIQHLVNYAVNRGSDKHTHINVDAEGYRSKREDSLENLARKMAAKVLKYKRSMALEPMNSYERHVIHTALQNYEGVSTSSIGTEPNRRVVVNYERPAGEAPEGSRRRSRGERKNAPRADKPERTAAPGEEAAPAPAEETAPPAETPAAEPVKEKAPPDFPEGYTPPSKNKPQSREWC